MAPWNNVHRLGGGQYRHGARLRFLERFCCNNDGEILLDFEGIEALNGTDVQTFHEQMLTYALPFRVNVRTETYTQANLEMERRPWHVHLPPIMVNPSQPEWSSWNEFRNYLLEWLTTYKKSN